MGLNKADKYFKTWRTFIHSKTNAPGLVIQGMRISQNYLSKLRYTLPLFTFAAWGSVFLLCFVRWFLFFGKHPILELDEEIWHFWIPAFFPFIPLHFLLKPRFDALRYSKKNNKGTWFMQLMAWIPMVAMLSVAQHYLTTASGKLLELDNIKEISKNELVRYYRIRNFAVHKGMGGVHPAFRTTGKYNQTLEIDIYFAHPILTHKTQLLTMTPLYWYGVKFHKQIGNGHSKEKKEARFQEFFRECVEKMNSYDYHKLDHFEHKPASYDRANFRQAVQYAVGKPVNNNFVILQPRSEAAELRDGHKVAWIFGCFFMANSGKGKNIL